MEPEDVGGVHRQRRIHVDQHVGNQAGALQPMQLVDQLLHAAHGEGGDEDLAAALAHLVHPAGEQLLRLRDRFMHAVGVGALDDEHVGGPVRRGRLGIADDGQAGAADVAREHEARRPARRGDVEHDRRAAQDVAGVVERERDAREDLRGVLIGHAHHRFRHRRAVFRGVQRLGLRVLVDPLEELPVLLLDEPGVGQHDGAQVLGGAGAVDGAAVAALAENGQPAGVVDVRVGQHDGVHVGRREREVLVLLARLLAAALEHAAVEQDALAGRLEQVHRARDLAGRAEKRQAH